MKVQFKRLLSGILGAVMTIGATPVASVYASLNEDCFLYTMFAASHDIGAITVNANNFCLNGNLATNGSVVSTGNMNINGTQTENAGKSMVYIFDRIERCFFSTSDLEMFDNDYEFNQINININSPMTVRGTAILSGNVTISNAFKALGEINISGDTVNSNNSILLSKYADIIINSQNVSLNGLIYAPFGKVDITAQSINLNNTIIIADEICLNAANVNVNNNSSMSSFVGSCSETPAFPIDEWKYLKDENENGLPDYFEIPENVVGLPDTDKDCLPDLFEMYFGTDLNSPDTDGDGLEDATELAASFTSPLKKDTDENGIIDGNEDFDGDGLTNVQELQYGTIICQKDTDYDGLLDYEEVFEYNTDPTLIDTDGDTVSDYDEVEIGLNPLLVDTDNDGKTDDKEKTPQTYEYKIDKNDSVIESISVVANATGNLKKTTSIEDITESSVICADVVGLVGNPFEITTESEFDAATLVFKVNSAMLENIALDDLMILWYDEINDQFYEMETVSDPESTTVSTVTTHFSKYMIVDKNTWFQAWAVDLNYKHNPYIDGKPFNDPKNTKDICAVLAVDCSKSMNSRDDIIIRNDISSQYDAQFRYTCGRIKAGNGYISILSDSDQIGIVLFEKNVSTENIIPLTNDKMKLLLALQKIHNKGGTSFYNALDNAFNLFSEDDLKDGRKVKRIILMSDGIDNYPTSTNALLTSIYNPNSRDLRRNVKIDTIAFGSDADKVTLNRISDMSGGDFYTAQNAAELVNLYSEMSVKDVLDTFDHTDTDGDGLFDVFEITGIRLSNGTIVYTDPLNPDSDGDGKMDGEEIGPMSYRNAADSSVQFLGIDNELVFDEDGNKVNIRRVHGFHFSFTSYPNIIDSDRDGYNDSIDKTPLIPFDRGFQEVRSFGYEPSIDFVTQRYEHSQQCYNTYVGDHPLLEAWDFGVEMRLGLGLISIISALTPIPGLLFGLKEKNEAGTAISRINNVGVMPHASYALIHYLSRSGTPIHYDTVNTCQMLYCSTANLAHLQRNVERAIFYSYDRMIADGTYYFASKSNADFKALCFDSKGATDGGAPCNVSHHSGYSNDVHMDWQNTIGESYGAMTVGTTKQGTHYSMRIRYYIKDIYEWAWHYDNLTLSAFFHALHESGFAQEFLMDGVMEFTIEWDGIPVPKDTNIMKQIALQMRQNVIINSTMKDLSIFHKNFSEFGVTII